MMLYAARHYAWAVRYRRRRVLPARRCSALPMPERMTLANMAAELGAQDRDRAPGRDDARFSSRPASRAPDIVDSGTCDATRLSKRRATSTLRRSRRMSPRRTIPANIAPVGAHRGVAIDQAYIGACTGAKLEDLEWRRACSPVERSDTACGCWSRQPPCAPPRKRRLTARLQLLPKPAPFCCRQAAAPAPDYGAGLLAEEEVCISSTARNFKGRMGAATAEVWLGSPYTVAAAAVAGGSSIRASSCHDRRHRRPAHAFGDRIDTDVLAPGVYMKSPWLKWRCIALRPSILVSRAASAKGTSSSLAPSSESAPRASKRCPRC